MFLVHEYSPIDSLVGNKYLTSFGCSELAGIRHSEMIPKHPNERISKKFISTSILHTNLTQVSRL